MILLQISSVFPQHCSWLPILSKDWAQCSGNGPAGPHYDSCCYYDIVGIYRSHQIIRFTYRGYKYRQTILYIVPSLPKTKIKMLIIIRPPDSDEQIGKLSSLPQDDQRMAENTLFCRSLSCCQMDDSLSRSGEQLVVVYPWS